MQLLGVMGYASRASGRALRSRKDIRLLICGDWKHATTGACLMDGDGCLLLLVQEDKRQLDIMDSETQPIAKAITAVQSNNQT